MNLGVCYYPEHWPANTWADQCAKMRAAGIDVVRIAEFCWTQLEPQRDQFDFAWLDQAVDVIASSGLKIIFCTPTATPPKWLIDEAPEKILAVDADGNPRRFGSRRHYCFSSKHYRKEALRISEIVVKRYAQNPAIIGWQTDNEYGCHETTVSYSTMAQSAFRDWLKDEYQTVDKLNHAWGTVFWSQEYQDFSQLDAPFQTVTEANPSHRLDYQRFSSDQVIKFNRAQTDLIRQHVSDEVWITHNAMGNFLEFDHYDLGQDLDVITWDEYPLGFLQQAWFSDEEKQTYRRIGHPDWAAFHHDLYRAAGNGRFGVIELQPGAVNWANYNAQPITGAVKLWGMEAVAHGAELVSYFRWQQPPFAQEQMHMALNFSNGESAPAYSEVQQLAEDIKKLSDLNITKADVALVFDYQSTWMVDIQPQAERYNALQVSMEYYTALRKLGLNVDLVPPNADVSGYKMVVCPCTLLPMPRLANSLDDNAVLLLGPRSASKTADYQLPIDFPPAHWQSLIPLRVVTVDAIREEVSLATDSLPAHRVHTWVEQIETQLTPEISTTDGRGIWYRYASTAKESRPTIHYVGALSSQELTDYIVQHACLDAGFEATPLANGLRIRTLGGLSFAFNFGPNPVTLDASHKYLVGSSELGVGDYAVYR